MTTTVTATYANGVLTPEEPLDLEEGKQVTLSIEDVPLSDGAPAGEAHGESLIEMFARLRKSVPPGSWDDMPIDGAQNYRHYLYGYSKGRASRAGCETVGR